MRLLQESYNMPPLVQYFKIAAATTKAVFQTAGSQVSALVWNACFLTVQFHFHVMVCDYKINDPCICSISTLSLVDIWANFSVKTCEVFLCFVSYNYFPSPTMTSFFLVKDQLLWGFFMEDEPMFQSPLS